jgi:hypothetical protein
MPYKLFIGDTSLDVVTFNHFRREIGDTHAGRVSLIGGQTEIRDLVNHAEFSTTKQQEFLRFTTDAVRFYMLSFHSADEARVTQEKLERSDLPLIFFGTHGAGDIP